MNLKAKHITLSAYLILLFLHTSTAFGQTEDSIKFSINESKCLVDAWQTLPGIVKINDSLKEANAILQFDLNQCESLKNEYKQQNKNYQAYAKTISEEIDKQDIKLKRSEKWRKIWRKSTAWTGSIAAILVSYEIIKPKIHASL